MAVLRYIIFAAFLLVSVLSPSRDNLWRTYPAYTQPVQVRQYGSQVYCVMTGGLIDLTNRHQTTNGNLLSYDTEDGTIHTYGTNVLNGVHVSTLSFNSDTGRLVIIYDDYNMDIMDSEGNVSNLPVLAGTDIIIKGVSQAGRYTLLFTPQSILQVDPVRAVVLNTYKTAHPVSSMCLHRDSLCMATSDGIYKVGSYSELYDSRKWKLSQEGSYSHVASFDGNLIAIPSLSGYTDLQQTADMLLLQGRCDGTGARPLGILTRGMTAIQPLSASRPWGDYTISGTDRLLVSDENEGIIPLRYDRAANTLRQDGEPIPVSVNSPRRDAFWRISFDSSGRLLAAGGINTQSDYYYPATSMMMNTDGSWVNVDEREFQSLHPTYSHFNTDMFVSDPADPGHFYAAVYRNGLQEFRLRNGEFRLTGFYNYQNSPLRVIKGLENSPEPYNYCTCTSLTYDANGNLWMANQQTDTIVRILRPDGQWLALYYDEIRRSTNVFQYLIDTKGVSFLVSSQGSPKGFFGFDTNGTLNYTDDDRTLLRSSITNQDETSYTPNIFYCMARDRDNQIWCGTSDGLFVILDPSEWFDSSFRYHQIKRNRDDGSGYADYLLSEVEVTAIAVDAADRKWIGTRTEGVYLISPDGQETIYHFTSKDTPLLSDNINSIAIAPNDGTVYFATPQGLCSFQEGVTPSAPELSEKQIRIYPNPVRPGTDAPVTIDHLVDRSDVKILSSSGQCIYATQSVGGTVRWPLVDLSGTAVSSGVYHVVVNSPDGSPVIVKRLIVIR